MRHCEQLNAHVERPCWSSPHFRLRGNLWHGGYAKCYFSCHQLLRDEHGADVFSVALQFVRIMSNVNSALKSYVLVLYYPQYLVNMGLLAFTGFVHVSCVCNSMNIMRH
jgi:hypothetical protein